MTNSFECFKCSGSGHIAAFSGIANGVCFQCSGTGKLTSSKQTGVAFTPQAPVIAEALRSTTKQWEFLGRLCGDSDSKCCKVLKAAGADHASQIYVSKLVMSRAIDIAKGKGA